VTSDLAGTDTSRTQHILYLVRIYVLRHWLGDKAPRKYGHMSRLASAQYGIHLGRLGIGEVGKGIGTTPSRLWWTPCDVHGRANRLEAGNDV
jgi:hypothetical protein